MAVISETGAQLFARLGDKPSLESLEPRLIPPGLHPSPGEVVEVYGASGSGKTELLLNLTARAILPGEWRGARLEGLSLGVVFIDTDHQFSMLRLFDILEKQVTEATSQTLTKTQREKDGQTKTHGEKGDDFVSQQNMDSICESEVRPLDAHLRDSIQSGRADHKESKPSEDEIEAFLKSCLKRLFVVRVGSSEQLVVTLHSLESLLASHNISLLLLDTVSAFHWIDRMKGDGAHHQPSNQRLAFTVLAKLLVDYHLVVFATKAALISKQQSHDSGLFIKQSHDTAAFANQSHDFADDDSTVTQAANSSMTAGSSNQLNTEHYEFMSKDWTKLVTHRVILERRDSINPNHNSSSFRFCLRHKASGSAHFGQFCVCDHGIVHQ